MDQFYKASYFNRRNWILEKAGTLNLTADELLLVLLMDYGNEFCFSVNANWLQEKSRMDEDQVDIALSGLINKGFLSMETRNRSLYFNIDSLFEEKTESINTRDIFDIFEDEFGRLLNQKELMELNELLTFYKQDDILYALRQASIYNKKTFPYIRSILTSIQKGRDNDSN